MALGFGLLLGCGEGGASGPPLEACVRTAVLEAVNSATASVTDDNFVAETPRVLSLLQSKPEIREAFAEPNEARTIWARFMYGRWLVISRNRPVPPARRVGALLPTSGFELPSSGRATLYSSFYEDGFGNAS